MSTTPHFLFQCTKLICVRKRAISEIWIMAWILWRDTLCWSTQAGDLSNDSLIDFMSQEGLRVMVTVLVRLAHWHVNPNACVSSIHGRVTQTLLSKKGAYSWHAINPLTVKPIPTKLSVLLTAGCVYSKGEGEGGLEGGVRGGAHE